MECNGDKNTKNKMEEENILLNFCLIMAPFYRWKEEKEKTRGKNAED